VTLAFRDVDTPAGAVRLVFNGNVLVGLAYADRWDGLERTLTRRFGTFALAPADAAAQPALERFEAYLDGDLGALEAIEADPGGTPFQARVWKRLRAIPAGETLSYGALAEALGQPTATRAVAAANGQNPIAIVIPCHRVIAKDGSLWGYGGGLPRKEWLLAHEGVVTPSLTAP
jgi:methylated-DNA-[protein]-cysteine S-methyltransferase